MKSRPRRQLSVSVAMVLEKGTRKQSTLRAAARGEIRANDDGAAAADAAVTRLAGRCDRKGTVLLLSRRVSAPACN